MSEKRPAFIIQEVYKMSTIALQEKLIELDISLTNGSESEAIEYPTRIEDLINLLHKHPDKAEINTIPVISDNCAYSGEENEVGGSNVALGDAFNTSGKSNAEQIPVYNQAYIFKADDFNNTMVEVKVVQVYFDRCIIRFPNNQEREITFKRLFSH